MVDEQFLVKKPKIHIPDDDPFANDELGRKEYAEKLTGFLSTIEEPFVLAIDAGFGQGKTTFVEMWKRYLEQRGFAALLFNAWKHDFTHDPLV